jgi:beta-phosphoglucomutase-like phosphatase (HAD superfamily)
MKAIIFDMDGVLVDTMPSHFQAMRTAVAEIAKIDLKERTFYMLEGMPIMEMARKILDLEANEIRVTNLGTLAEKISMRKKEIFMQMKQIPEPFSGVKELIFECPRSCLKAVVTGSSKQELDTIIENNFGSNAFTVAINGDEFEGKGKPDPAAYLAALSRLGVRSTNALVVENAPLGVQAARRAGVKCIVVLNSSPLPASDFSESIENESDIFEDLDAVKGFLKKWCAADEL